VEARLDEKHVKRNRMTETPKRDRHYKSRCELHSVKEEEFEEEEEATLEKIVFYEKLELHFPLEFPYFFTRLL